MANNDTVAHAWAQDDDTVSRAQAGHLRWVRRGTEHVLYSYAMPIAAIVDGKAGRVCLISSDSVTNTTTRHIGAAWGASTHRHPFGVPCVLPSGKDDHARNLNAYLNRSASTGAASLRSRKHAASLMESAVRCLDEAARYAEAFGIKWARPADPAGAAERIAKFAKAEARRRVAKARAQRKADAERFAGWLAGEHDVCPRSFDEDSDGSVYLRRVNHVHDMAQTSRGAVVPWSDALRLFGMCSKARANGYAWTRTEGRIRGPAFGPYTLDAIDAEGNATVGCHRISFARMSELAEREGVSLDGAEV